MSHILSERVLPGDERCIDRFGGNLNQFTELLQQFWALEAPHVLESLKIELSLVPEKIRRTINKVTQNKLQITLIDKIC